MTAKKTDALKLLFAVGAFMGGAIFHLLNPELSYVVRLAVAILAALIGLVLVLNTSSGVSFRGFLSASRDEFRKVIWPSHSEATKISIITVVSIFVLSVVFWGVDLFFVEAVRVVTGL